MDFDEVIDRRGTHSSKWDTMEELYGVSPDNGLSMWVADMDFRAPEVIQRKLRSISAHGIYGYYGDQEEYKNSIKWWMKNRHDWKIDTSWIFTTHGLVNGTALCIDAFTKRGDGVILFTPVYYQFSNLIEASERKVVECPLKLIDNHYQFDFNAYERKLSGDEKMIILSSPHNPGGRVWTRKELQEVAKFAMKHDLILVSDEIHHDLVYPNKNHTVMPLAEPAVCDRLVMMTATTKTFNIAGAHTGNVIISNPHLQQKFSKRIIFCAASTHQEEELFIGRVHKELKSEIKNLITIIIPRHINRKKEILNELKNIGLNSQLHTSPKKLSQDTDIYIVDTYGETTKFYTLSKLTFLGGSLIPHGGQNPLESAREGNYILYGPHVENFKEVYEMLEKLKITTRINSIKNMKSIVRQKINF